MTSHESFTNEEIKNSQQAKIDPLIGTVFDEQFKLRCHAGIEV